MDRKELKIQALLEKISNLTTNYENQVADLRVELTVLGKEVEELKNALAEAQAQFSSDTDEAD